MENKKNIIAIIENIRAAKELSVEEKAQFDALTLQDWADLLNDGEKVTDLADKAAKNKTLQIKKKSVQNFSQWTRKRCLQHSLTIRFCVKTNRHGQKDQCIQSC